MPAKRSTSKTADSEKSASIPVKEQKDQNVVSQEDEKFSFHSSWERFECMISLIKGLVMRYMRSHSARLFNDVGSFDAARPGAREVLELAGIKQETDSGVVLDSLEYPALPVIDAQLDRFRAVIAKRISATVAMKHPEYLVPERIREQFGLSAAELLLLCAVAAPQIDNDITRLYQFATGLDSTIFPGSFYADLVAVNGLSPQDVLAMLERDRPLLMYSLVEAGQRPDWGALTPVLHAPLSVPNRIASFLAGRPSDDSLEYAEVFHATKRMPVLVFEDDFKKSAFAALKRANARVAFWGTRGFGRRSLIREFAALMKMTTLEVDFSRIAVSETPSHFLSVAGLWFREARLNRAVLVFRCERTQSTEVDSVLEQCAPAFRRMIDAHPGTICILAANAL